MNKTTNVFVAATIASFVGGAAMAQQSIFTDPTEDRIEDLQEDIDDDFERDVEVFGNEGRALGFTGSISARGTATSGNTDSTDIGVGTQLGFFDGVNGHKLALSYVYGEDDAGVTTEDSLFATYDYTRDFSTNFFGFAKIQAQYDGEAEDGAFEDDAFVGFGVGYRIFNSPDMQWSVQAGPGYRVANLSDPEGVFDTVTDFDEAALSLSSDYYTRISPTVFVTNDTDILSSESDTSVINELGLNVSMTDQLALRTSLLTEYHTDPLGDADDTDNTFGLSLVYTFN